MTKNTILIRCAAAGAIFASTLLATGAATAHADHVHSVKVGNGACVLLARQGGEGHVDLPFADEALVLADRAHSLHLLVHLGRPGQNLEIGVHGAASDPCRESGAYGNG